MVCPRSSGAERTVTRAHSLQDSRVYEHSLVHEGAQAFTNKSGPITDTGESACLFHQQVIYVQDDSHTCSYCVT